MLSLSALRVSLPVLAAVLVFGVSACSSEKEAPEEPAISTKADVKACQELLDKQVAFEVGAGVQLEGSSEQVVTKAKITKARPLTCEVSVEITDLMLGTEATGKATISDRPDSTTGSPVSLKASEGSFSQVETGKTKPRFDATSTVVGYEQAAEMFKAETKEYPNSAKRLRQLAADLGADTAYGNGRFFTYKIKLYEPTPKGANICVVHEDNKSWAFMGADGVLVGMGDKSTKSKKTCVKNLDRPKAPKKEEVKK